MLNSAASVIFPASLALLSQQIWRVEYLASHLMLFGFELDVELFEFLGLHYLVDSGDNALETLSGMGDLVFLKVSHLSRIRGKVLRQGSFSATLSG